MKDATNTMLCWNPGGEVRLVPWPAEGRARNLHMSALACWGHVRGADFRDRQIAVFAEAMAAIVRDGCSPNAVHQACLGLEEYRAAIAEDMLTPFPDPLHGRHYCIIEESEWVKTPWGGYLELVLKVIKGDREGLRIIDRLHLNHAGNPVLQEFAYRHLADYCHLTGQVQLMDSSQLHGIPFWVWLDDVGAGHKWVARLQEESRPGWFKPRGEPFTVEVLDD